MPWKTVRMSGNRGNIARFNTLPAWLTAGGIQLTDWLGVWQPKGAASYAASKISLVNPSASNLLVDGTAHPTWTAADGWDFKAASLQYLTIASAILATVPITMVCKFNLNDAAALYAFMSICDFNLSRRFSLEANGTIAGDPVRAVMTKDGTTGLANSLSGYTAGNWYTATAVFAAIDNRSIYLNGGSKSTNTTSSTPVDLDVTYIGAIVSNTVISYYPDGKISACGFLNKALSDAQVLAIHNAMSIL
jgi:hypothetical protein